MAYNSWGGASSGKEGSALSNESALPCVKSVLLHPEITQEGRKMKEIDLQTLRMMVIVMGQSLLTGQPFALLLGQFDTSIGTKLHSFPGVSAVESDHLTAEFQDAWVNLSRAVQMLPPLP